MKAAQLAACVYGCERKGCAHVQQEESLPTAEIRQVRWSPGEIAFIKATMHRGIGDVASALGRTYYATALARSRAKRGIL